MSYYRPRVSGAVTFMFAVFAGLALAAWSGGMRNIWFMVLDWAAVLTVSFWMFWNQRRKQESGAADLVIDSEAKRLELPAHFGRKARETFSFSDIADIEVETVERRGPRGSRTYVSEVRLVSATGKRELIEERGDREEAEDFAHWLRAHVSA